MPPHLSNRLKTTAAVRQWHRRREHRLWKRADTFDQVAENGRVWIIDVDGGPDHAWNVNTMTGPKVRFPGPAADTVEQALWVTVIDPDIGVGNRLWHVLDTFANEAAARRTEPAKATAAHGFRI